MVHVLPAPQNEGTVPLKQRTREYINEMRSLGLELPEETNGRRAVYNLLSNDPKLMDRVMDSIRSCDKEGRDMWALHFEQASSPTSNWKDDKLGYEHLVVNMKLLPALKEAKGNPVSLQRRFRSMEMMLKIPFGHEKYSQVQAGLIIADIDPFPVSLNGREEDIEFIAEHIDDVLHLVPVLRERQSTDRHLITELLANKTPSLTEGVL